MDLSKRCRRRANVVRVGPNPGRKPVRTDGYRAESSPDWSDHVRWDGLGLVCRYHVKPARPRHFVGQPSSADPHFRGITSAHRTVPTGRFAVCRARTTTPSPCPGAGMLPLHHQGWTSTTWSGGCIDESEHTASRVDPAADQARTRAY